MSPTPATVLDADIVELPGGARALFTSRAHGNLSSVGGEHAEHGLQARERLRETLGVRRLLRGYQVHGTVVGRVFADGARPNATLRHTPAGAARPNPFEHDDGAVADLEHDDGAVADLEHDDGAVAGRTSVLEPDSAQQPVFEADGHATAAPGLAAMVFVADCIPVVLGAEGAVAALHAGWRGLAAGVLQEGVRALREVGGHGGVVAVVGPCAGACCYEVGEEVHAAFGGAHRNGRPIDLRAIAHQRLQAAGVEEVRDVRACTICDERFFSHRREGTRAGRQAGVAWIEQ